MTGGCDPVRSPPAAPPPPAHTHLAFNAEREKQARSVREPLRGPPARLGAVARV